jgi:heme-degrading monooxygenase HmoA
MFVLHIELKVKHGRPQTLEKTFADTFLPAISAQQGFAAAQLLRSNDDGTDYRLCLTFDHQASQQKWVATDLHQQVWSLVENLCVEYSVKGFSTA